MMRKIMATLLALTMALVLNCALAMAEDAEEKTYAEEHPGVVKYDGYWVSEDGGTLIEIGVRLDGVEMVIYRTPGQKEFTSWEYLLTYDDATGALHSDNGMKSTNTVQEDGGLGSSSVYEYEGGQADFSINEEGRLVWKDLKEDAGAGQTFIPIGGFLGDYVCDRASISFRWNEGHYAVDINWADSAMVNNIWQYVGEYDPAARTVTAKGLYQKLTYKEDGTVDTDADFEEREVSAVFSFDEDFNLIWTSPDGEGDGMVFENLFTAAYLFEI
ncbi:MAG: hypothetical protein IJ231_07340 [Clostridia bacterium]|nr:hypothetical protein [Clostridia bacterium]